MAEKDDSLGDRIERALSYPAAADGPATEEDRRESAEKAEELKETLEDETGADVGPSGL